MENFAGAIGGLGNFNLMQNALDFKLEQSYRQGGLAATFDLAAFRKVMIAPVKKSVNHSKTVTSVREMRRIHAILSVATRRWKTHSY